ncbi:MAG TPA: YraN family protein [Clostridiales bacterium]|nr:YraN family protein [Clostridiales bacterium]
MTSGARGEQRAAEYLVRRGFRILCRNYRSKYGEIDLICADDSYLSFVEVKTRSSTKFGAPREAVTKSKQQKIILTAQCWLAENPTALQPRFDVIEVFVTGSLCRINHIPNAFEVV